MFAFRGKQKFFAKPQKYRHSPLPVRSLYTLDFEELKNQIFLFRFRPDFP